MLVLSTSTRVILLIVATIVWRFSRFFCFLKLGIIEHRPTCILCCALFHICFLLGKNVKLLLHLLLIVYACITCFTFHFLLYLLLENTQPKCQVLRANLYLLMDWLDAFRFCLSIVAEDNTFVLL